MIDIPYDPFNWYWQVADRTDYWSSAAAAYVETLPEGQMYSPIASEVELSDVLRKYGLRGPVISNEDVNVERDRRTATLFIFNSIAYQCDERSQQNITAKGAQAKFAILAGAQPNDLRWANPNASFGWIATDNNITPMDAQTMAEFADAADLWVTSHIMAGLALKGQNPIPQDYADDKYWPTGGE